MMQGATELTTDKYIESLTESYSRAFQSMGSKATNNLLSSVEFSETSSRNKNATKLFADDAHHSQPESNSSSSLISHTISKNLDAPQQKLFYKTKLCPFLSGLTKCRRGRNCNYAHSEEELQKPRDLQKTRLCVAYVSGKCNMSAADCKYAHGVGNLRSTPEYYKTGLCRYFLVGDQCPHEQSCRHAHGIEELRQNNLRPETNNFRSDKKLPAEQLTESKDTEKNSPPSQTSNSSSNCSEDIIDTNAENISPKKCDTSSKILPPPTLNKRNKLSSQSEDLSSNESNDRLKFDEDNKYYGTTHYQNQDMRNNLRDNNNLQFNVNSQHLSSSKPKWESYPITSSYNTKFCRLDSTGVEPNSLMDPEFHFDQHHHLFYKTLSRSDSVAGMRDDVMLRGTNSFSAQINAREHSKLPAVKNNHLINGNRGPLELQESHNFNNHHHVWRNNSNVIIEQTPSTNFQPPFYYDISYGGYHHGVHSMSQPIGNMPFGTRRSESFSHGLLNTLSSSTCLPYTQSPYQRRSRPQSSTAQHNNNNINLNDIDLNRFKNKQEKNNSFTECLNIPSFSLSLLKIAKALSHIKCDEILENNGHLRDDNNNAINDAVPVKMSDTISKIYNTCDISFLHDEMTSELITNNITKNEATEAVIVLLNYVKTMG